MEDETNKSIFAYIFDIAYDSVLYIVWGVISELTKFTIVLMTAYMLLMGIFYLWERDLQNRGQSLSTQSNQHPPSVHRITEGSLGKYPYVVEIPRASLESVKKSKAKPSIQIANNNEEPKLENIETDEEDPEVIEQRDSNVVNTL